MNANPEPDSRGLKIPKEIIFLFLKNAVCHWSNFQTNAESVSELATQ